jgi:hypothetical protein
MPLPSSWKPVLDVYEDRIMPNELLGLSALLPLRLLDNHRGVVAPTDQAALTSYDSPEQGDARSRLQEPAAVGASPTEPDASRSEAHRTAVKPLTVAMPPAVPILSVFVDDTVDDLANLLAQQPATRRPVTEPGMESGIPVRSSSGGAPSPAIGAPIAQESTQISPFTAACGCANSSVVG